MTKISKMKNKSEDMQGNIEHQKALLEALAPDPAEWVYKDEIWDAGEPTERCACGHKIRYIFPVYRKQDGKKEMKFIGSTCIQHFAKINQVTFDALCAAQARLEEQIASAERQAREAQQKVEVETARAEFEKALEQVREFYKTTREKKGSYYYFDRYIWLLVNRPSKYANPPEYKRASDFIRWYKKTTESIGKALDRELNPQFDGVYPY